MDFIRSLDNKSELLEVAKERALEIIKLKPNAKQANIDKAVKMVWSSTSKQKLMFGCCDFQLSHDGFKVIR